MTKKNRPSMSVAQFAALKGVSRQAVAKAIESGAIPPESTAWRKAGKRRVLTIVDVPLASRSWAPTGPASLADETPGELSDASSAREAKRVLLVFKAQQAKLDYETAAGRLVSLAEAEDVFAKQIINARNAFMRLGSQARARIPDLSVDDQLIIEEMVGEILDDLGSGKGIAAGKARPTRAKAHHRRGAA